MNGYEYYFDYLESNKNNSIPKGKNPFEDSKFELFLTNDKVSQILKSFKLISLREYRALKSIKISGRIEFLGWNYYVDNYIKLHLSVDGNFYVFSIMSYSRFVENLSFINNLETIILEYHGERTNSLGTPYPVLSISYLLPRRPLNN